MSNKNKEYAKLLQVVNNSNKLKLNHLIQFLAINLKKSIVECRQELNLCEQKGYVVALNKGTNKAITYKVTDKGTAFVASVMPKLPQTMDETDSVSIALGITENNSNKEKRQEIMSRQTLPTDEETNEPLNESTDTIAEMQKQIADLKKGQQELMGMLQDTLNVCKSFVCQSQQPKPSFIKIDEVVNNVLAFGYIYGTYDVKTNNMYVGQSTKLDRNSLENYKGSGVYISKELKERPNDFKKVILRVCYNQQELDKWEIILIEYYNSRNPNNGYNEQIGGTDRVESIHFAKQIGVEFENNNAIKQIHFEQTTKEKQYRSNCANETKS